MENACGKKIKQSGEKRIVGSSYPFLTKNKHFKNILLF